MLNELQIMQLPCNTSINYESVPGTPILPFLIELDTNNSILDPAPGQNQRFCYLITGVGQDTNLYRDLSHIVFGICDQIPISQITNIFVSVDGIVQPIIFGPGGNVELRTPDQPDPPTGCTGLKFNFGLNKASGIMRICYELTVPYPVGPNLVCLFGGDETRTGLSICGPVCGGVNHCESMAYQSATVCVPVIVTPFAEAGETTTFCCGNPIVTPGTNVCTGTPNGVCNFTISQNICIEVPVDFGANTNVGAPYVNCGTATNEDICVDCGF